MMTQNDPSVPDIRERLHEPIVAVTAGYFLVAVTESGEPIAVSACKDEETRQKLFKMLKATVLAGGPPLSPVAEPDGPRPIPGMPAWIQN